MKVLVSGASGFIGSALLPYLAARQQHVHRLVRPDHKLMENDIAWNPATGEIDFESIASADAVIHLAGASLSGRWTKARREEIWKSRVHSTYYLAQALSQLNRPPRVLITASAIGYYGNRGDEVLSEASAPGTGFLAELCREWENATASAQQAGIRVVHLRCGVVMNPRDGALARILPVFRWGLGGRIGSGNQYMSWISLEDLVGVISHALHDDKLYGPVNAVTPHAVTNREFTAALARALQRPALLPIPAALLRFLYGELANELLLASTRVFPQRLTEVDYNYQHHDLDGFFGDKFRKKKRR